MFDAWFASKHCALIIIISIKTKEKNINIFYLNQIITHCDNNITF